MTDHLDLPPLETLNEAQTALRDRAAEVGLPIHFRIDFEDEDARIMVGIYIDFPCARGVRTIRVPSMYVSDLLLERFEHVRLIDDVAAFFDPEAGTITALVDNPARSRPLSSIPGVESAPPYSDLPFSGRQREVEWRGVDWRLRLDDHESGRAVTFMPGSALASAVLEHRGENMVRISKANELTHDSAKEILEETIHRISFDFDVAYGVPLRVPRRYRRRNTSPIEESTKPAEYPTNPYPAEAVHLYQHGRQGSQLPTMEYLAYYQAVESLFPYFARAQAVHDIRSTILDPAFDPSTDRHITRLLTLAGSGAGSQSERQQLRATLQACVQEEQIVQFVKADEARLKALTKDRKIRGAEKLVLGNAQSDLREQLANRVYAIRCRIVHSKMDGGGNEDVLLPTGPEAAALEHDIDLLRFVAQRVLIARATRY